MIETLIAIIVLLLVCGMLCYCVQRIPGIPAPIPVVIEIIIVLIFAMLILNYSGVLGGGHRLLG